MFISHQEQEAAILAMSIPSTVTIPFTAPDPDSKPTFPMSITGSPFKDKLIASLDIPVELTDHRDIDLAYAWK